MKKANTEIDEKEGEDLMDIKADHTIMKGIFLFLYFSITKNVFFQQNHSGRRKKRNMHSCLFTWNFLFVSLVISYYHK